MSLQSLLASQNSVQRGKGLQTLLNIQEDTKKIGLSLERIEEIKPALRDTFAFWREYPDIFIDFMQTGGDPEKEKEITFRLFFYQRIFLRVAMRYKYVYAVYPRACLECAPTLKNFG